MGDPAHLPLKFELFSPILPSLSAVSLTHGIICFAAFETINIINQRPLLLFETECVIVYNLMLYLMFSCMDMKT